MEKQGEMEKQEGMEELLAVAWGQLGDGVEVWEEILGLWLKLSHHL